MTRITGSIIASEEGQGKITLETGNTARVTVNQGGDVSINGTVVSTSGTLTNSASLSIRPIVGSISSQTPGAVTAVTIAHGLGAVPTVYIATPASGGAITAGQFSITANSANIELRYAAALTAATAYGYSWIAWP